MIERKYRAYIVVGEETFDVHMAFTTEAETVDECDAKARAELAADAHSVLKGSKFWKLSREEWVEIPATEPA